MTKRKGRSRAPSIHRLRADAFPLLAGFLRGYLHEDLAVVHGSTRVAAEAFCGDASSEERLQLDRELTALLDASPAWPWHELQRFLTDGLGSPWEPHSREQLLELLATIRAER